MKKLQLIEKIIRIEDEALLMEVATILDKNSEPVKAPQSFKDFAGTLDEEELTQFQKAIDLGCETINPNDWK